MHLDDLTVILRDENVTPATETTLVRGATYDVTGGSGSTGCVDIIDPPSSNIPVSGEKLIIISDVSSTQPTSIPLGGAFPSTSVEQQLDKIVRLVQQVEEPPTNLELDLGIKIFNNTGSPEGSQTAIVGSLYLRTDGGASTTLYVKESGAGNTGWIAK